MKTTHVEILSVEEKSGVSHKSGSPKPYEIRTAHAVIYEENGKQVGIIRLPKGMPNPEPGHYEAEFGIAIDFQTREVKGVLVNLLPSKVSSVVSDAHIMGKDVADKKKAA